MNKRTILLLLGLAAIFAGVYAWREFGRTHQDTASRKADLEVDASTLLREFQADEAAATARYVGDRETVVRVTGRIRSIEPDGKGKVNVTLATTDELAGVVCEFAETHLPAGWRIGSEVAVKGICTGMLLDVVLVRCVPAD